MIWIKSLLIGLVPLAFYLIGDAVMNYKMSYSLYWVICNIVISCVIFTTLVVISMIFQKTDNNNRALVIGYVVSAVSVIAVIFSRLI